MHVYIEDISKHEGQEVIIKGWLHNRRSSGKIHFLILRDGTGFIQAVMSKATVGDEMFKAADHAEGARRRLPARSSPPVDPQRPATGDSSRAARDHQRRPRLLQFARLHP